MHKDELARLETIGVEAVLLEIARGKHGQPTSQLREEVEAWLRSKQSAAAAEASARRDAREEETLAIARKALAISERAERRAACANRIAITATVFAAIAIISSIVAAFIERGSLFPDRQTQPTVQPDSSDFGKPAG